MAKDFEEVVADIAQFTRKFLQRYHQDGSVPLSHVVAMLRNRSAQGFAGVALQNLVKAGDIEPDFHIIKMIYLTPKFRAEAEKLYPITLSPREAALTPLEDSEPTSEDDPDSITHLP